MLDQNLTTLLAALLGGFLSIIGGISANFYMQRALYNAERQKEMRSMIELIYKNTQKILKDCEQLENEGFYGRGIKMPYESLEKFRNVIRSIAQKNGASRNNRALPKAHASMLLVAQKAE